VDGEIVESVTPYRSSRDHLLDEIAIVRARALAHVSGKSGETDPPPPDLPTPELVARRVQMSLAAGVDLRLPEIEAAAALSAVERAVLLTTLAAEIDPLFRAVCRGLQGELAGPTLQVGTIVELVTGALEEAIDAALLFLPEGKLRANALVTVEDSAPPRDVPLQALKVKMDRNLALYLLGARATAAPPWISVVVPARVLHLARLPEEQRNELVAFLTAARDGGRRLLVEINGPEAVGKKFVAEGLCAELGRPLVVADCRQIAGDRDELGARMAELRRESILCGGVPYLDHYEVLLGKVEGPGAPPADGEHASQVVAASAVLTMPHEVQRFLSLCILGFVGGNDRFEALAQCGEVLRLHLPFPTPLQRAAIWGQVFEQLSATLDADVDLPEIGRKLALDPARIQSACKTAMSAARMRNLDQPVLTRADLLDASRHQLSHDLKSLAVRVDKAYRWEDLVISVDGYHALMELISYSQNAEQVYDTWGFAAKHGVAQGISALFSGPPGTGKTMCAGVIARELDMELFRVDLSRVVSKWIGETEKNLSRVFDEAEKSHAVLLFDEADSLFAKRTEVKSSVDRYANLEVNFLLQRMESFGGITLLTTNFEDTIDSAFKRRLTFRIRFEKPDADARAALWEKMFPPTAALAPDVDWALLGKKFEVSGGNIRNAAIRSAFLATAEGHVIDMDTISRATLREAREMGLLIADPTPEPGSTRGNGDDEPSPPPRDPLSPPPKLVPITRPRRS
jgi:ATPase family associated with various cellular activities (AAA)